MTLESLANFPSEVLALILGGSHYSLRLWKCGNLLLNSKLSSALQHLDMRHSTLLEARRPQLLFKFVRLRILSISTPKELFSSHIEWSAMRKALPETLETIHLDCSDSMNFLYHFSPSSSPLQPHYILSDPYGRGESRYVDLGVRFPRLTDLAVFHRFDASFRSILPADIAGLPPGLTRLKTNEISVFHARPTIMRHLPPCLTELASTLSFSFDTTNEDSLLRHQQDILEHCPPSLTSFGRIHLFSQARLLPPTLVKEVEVQFARATFADLPLGLAALEVTMKMISRSGADLFQWPTLLPPRLCDLRIDIAKNFPQIALGANIAHLPRTLTRLICTHGAKIDWNDLLENHVKNGALEPGVKDFWPPQLSVLATEAEPLVPGLLSLLPKTLTDWTLMLPERAEEASSELKVLEAFPPLLASLKIEAGRRGCPFLFDKALPNTLTKLIFSGFTLFPATIASLPASLKSLAFRTPLLHLLPTAIIWTLPPQLVNLHLGAWHNPWNHFLPRTLEVLAIDQLTGLTPASKGEFEHLPPTLTQLTIASSNSDWPRTTALLDDVFSPLPNLIHLTISFGEFSSGVLRKLPRRLESLQLPLTGISPEDAPFIPPLLTIARFGASVDWKMPELAAHWPLREQGSKHPTSFDFALRERRQALYH